MTLSLGLISYRLSGHVRTGSRHASRIVNCQESIATDGKRRGAGKAGKTSCSVESEVAMNPPEVL